MTNTIKIIDLFAGPGGLSEGFSAFEKDGVRPFKVACSVEKEFSAHKTLSLRAFYRNCADRMGSAPEEYYNYLRGEISRSELFEAHREFAQRALRETLGGPRALGADDEIIDSYIRSSLGNGSNPCVLIGGPPCQAYSIAGRARNRGIKGYRIEDDPRSELYREYLRVVHEFGPDVFVMENVKGLLSTKVDGNKVIDLLLEDLSHPSLALQSGFSGPRYQIYSLSNPPSDHYGNEHDPTDFTIKAENFGIPQTRHRVILLGVREDLSTTGKQLHLKEQDQVNLREVIQSLPRLRSGLSKKPDNPVAWLSCMKELASEIREARDEFAATASLMKILDRTCQKWNHPRKDRGARFVKFAKNQDPAKFLPIKLSDWLVDYRLEGVINHQSRGHMRSDLARYLYAICRAHVDDGSGFRSPRLREFPGALLPDHKNKNSGAFVDRFRVQNPDSPASTITSHIAKDGHYYIHYDSTQVRSLTVREAARIQTFPDNYFFEGNKTQQYVQVGNAVPPFLARQIAGIVASLLA